MTAAADDRHRLIHANTDKIEYLYDDAIREGISDPVIFLLDVRDPSARVMAEELTSPDVVQGHIAKAERDKTDHCLILRFTTDAARKLVASWPWGGKKLLNIPPPIGSYYVVAIGGSGITCVLHNNP